MFFRFLTRYLTMILLLFVFNLSGNQYQVKELSSSSCILTSATSINENGEVGGPGFKWDPVKGFFSNPYNGGYGGHGWGPYLNNAGVYSQSPINDSGDRYSINHLCQLCKNSIPIEVTLKWDNRLPLRVNNFGSVLGNIKDIEGKNYAVVFNESERSITFLLSIVKYPIYGVDINDYGCVVGWYNKGIGDFDGILWTPEYGAQILKGIRPSAINNSNIIVGSSHNQAVMWIAGLVIDVSDELNLDQDFSNELTKIEVLYDINDQGHMVGVGKAHTHPEKRAVLINKIN